MDDAAPLPVQPLVSVVIPALNEEKNLPYVLPEIPDEYEVIVVDGRSSDATAAVAVALRPTVSVIEQPGQGKGDALAAGFAAAHGEIIVMLDADGSTDVAEIPRFVAALQAGADYAKGSRFLDSGGSADITRIRRFGNFLLSSLVNRLFGSLYTDLCYGYNAFWRRCLADLRIDCTGFEVETLINVRVLKAGLHVVEVPSFEGARIHGASNLHAVRDGARVLHVILREWRSGRTAARPRRRPLRPRDRATVGASGGMK